MNTRLIKNLFVVLISLALIGCGGGVILTKQEAFPEMYNSGKQPLSVLVIPAVNKSTAADAPDFYGVTVAEQLSMMGYYVYPLEVVTEILRNEGVIDTEMISGLPPSAFKEGFGADAVLFVTINSWDTNYYVFIGNVEVGLDFVMYSTTTNEVLWSYAIVAKVDTSSSSENFIVDAITTAISSALTKYVTVAKQANSMAFLALPVGPYHESHGTDGAEQVVDSEAKDKALEPQAK
jgi:hypothetical protein